MVQHTRMGGAHTVFLVVALAAGQQEPTHTLRLEHVVADVERPTQAQLSSDRVVLGHLRPYLTIVTLAGEVRWVGQAGDGPGELRSARYAGFLGDSVWVGDSRHRRVTVFPPNGTPTVHSATLEGWAFMPLAYFGDGLVLGTADSPKGAGLFAAQRGRTDQIAVIKPITYLTVEFGGGSQGPAMRMAHPLDTSTLVGFDLQRQRVITVDRSEADGFRVTWMDASGTSVLSRTYDVTPRRFSSDFATSLADQWWDIYSTASAPVSRDLFRRSFIRAIGSPRYIPPVRSLMVANSGELWVETGFRPGESSVWTVLSTSGEIMATLEVPLGKRLLSADGSRVLVLEDDTQLVLHRLTG